MSAFFSDLRVSALAMFISNSDLLPGPNDATCRETNDPERVHQEKPGVPALGSRSRLPKALIVVDAFRGKQKQAGSRQRAAGVGDRQRRGRRAFGLLQERTCHEFHELHERNSWPRFLGIDATRCVVTEEGLALRTSPSRWRVERRTHRRFSCVFAFSKSCISFSASPILPSFR